MSFFSHLFHKVAHDGSGNIQGGPSVEELLQYASKASADGSKTDTREKSQCEALINAPLFTVAAQTTGEHLARQISMPSDLVPQYGLIGSRQDHEDSVWAPEDRLLLANLNVPWSAFICGSQGAGKSHTLSCLLEACLIKSNPTGRLSHPMAGLVFHYDSFTSESASQVCEAAYLCSSGIPVRILAAPSNIWALTRMYHDLPNLPKECQRPKVAPFYLDSPQLNISRILKLMAIDPSSSKAPPLYMEIVMRIIREIAMEGIPFTYGLFRERLAAVKFTPEQQRPLDMRLQLLDAFLVPELTPNATKPAAAEDDIWDFPAGTLTVVDLSDPFLSSDDACGLFSVCLSVFLEKRTDCSRVVAMDEAHKFLTASGAAIVLTEELTSIIRQQRHISTRVLIATQEPTLSPKLIDLCNATFIHRFSSPAWYQTLRKHLAGLATGEIEDKTTKARHDVGLFQKITQLRTGEALVFCPTAQTSGLLNRRKARGRGEGLGEALGSGHMRISVRKRITFDGGVSLMATASTMSDQENSQQAKGSNYHEIKMSIPHKDVQKGLSNSGERKDLPTASTKPLPQKAGKVVSPNLVNGNVPAAPAIHIPTQHNTGVQPSCQAGTRTNVSAGLKESVRATTVASSVHKIVKVEDRKALYEVARRHVQVIAATHSWKKGTMISSQERERHFDEFMATVEITGIKKSKAQAMMALFGEIGNIGVRIR